jgi:hypothetical protein
MDEIQSGAVAQERTVIKRVSTGRFKIMGKIFDPAGALITRTFKR